MEKSITLRDLVEYDVIRITETVNRNIWDRLAGVKKRHTYEVQLTDIFDSGLLVLVFLDSFMPNEQTLATQEELQDIINEADLALARRRVFDGSRLNTVWMRLSA